MGGRYLPLYAGHGGGRYLPLYAGHRGGEGGTNLCMLVIEEGRVSNLVFYAQSTLTVISGQRRGGKYLPLDASHRGGVRLVSALSPVNHKGLYQG